MKLEVVKKMFQLKKIDSLHYNLIFDFGLHCDEN